MSAVPEWRLEGEWFDVCTCDLPCPCEFAQSPTNDACFGVLAFHVNDGRYGDVALEDLNVLALGAFTGNFWSGESKMDLGLFVDDRADEAQFGALQIIFGGQAGGWPACWPPSSATCGASRRPPSPSRSTRTWAVGGP